jgi:Rha family phage regulatory protein
MTSLIPAVALVDGIPRASSLDIAKHFKKQHKDVMRAINRAISQVPEDFNRRNFAPVTYVDEKGEIRPMYLLSYEGFSLVAMSFTGKAAVQWKVAYIETFRAMAEELAGQFHQALAEAPVDVPVEPLPRSRSTVAERAPLRALVMVWCKASRRYPANLWQIINAHFEIPNIAYLPVERVPEAIAWVQRQIDALPKALPAPEPKAKQPKALPAADAPSIDRDIDQLFDSMRHYAEKFREAEREAFQLVKRGISPALPHFDARRSVIVLAHNSMENTFYAIDKQLDSALGGVKAMLTTSRL